MIERVRRSTFNTHQPCLGMCCQVKTKDKIRGCLCHHSKTYNHLLSKYLKSEEEKNTRNEYELATNDTKSPGWKVFVAVLSRGLCHKSITCKCSHKVREMSEEELRFCYCILLLNQGPHLLVWKNVSVRGDWQSLAPAVFGIFVQQRMRLHKDWYLLIEMSGIGFFEVTSCQLIRINCKCF